MKKYNNEDQANENASFPSNGPQHNAYFDRDDREDDKEEDDDRNDTDDVEEETEDWGNIDPAGGEAPTSPGSAV